MRLREEARVRRVLAALKHLSPRARGEAMAALEVLVGACDATRRRDAAGNRLDGDPREAGDATGGPGCLPPAAMETEGRIAR